MNHKLSTELNYFKNVWKGGFTQCYSDWKGQTELVKVIHNLNFTKCLEIGCGRGHWSEMLSKRGELVVIDAKSKEDNAFPLDVEYHHIKDFELNEIEDDSIDLVFSYDVWCHISKSGQELYLKNLHKKLKSNGECYIMIADVKKFYNATKNEGFIRCYINHEDKSLEECFEIAELDADGEPAPGCRWYWIGLKNFKELVLKYNYEIIEEDINTDPSSPIVRFKKK